MQTDSGSLKRVTGGAAALPGSAGTRLDSTALGSPTTVSVSPATSGPVPPDTTVAYDVTVTNHDVGGCGTASYQPQFTTFDPSFQTSFEPFFQNAESGATVHFRASVTGNENADPGLHELPFEVFNFGDTFFEDIPGTLIYELATPTGCFVSTRRELMITHLSVVDDPVRTAGNQALFDGGIISPPFPGGFGGGPTTGGSGVDGGAGSTGTAGSGAGGSGGSTPAIAAGAWSFGHLMRELAPTPEDAPRMVEQMLRTFTTTQVVNGFSIAPRPGMQNTVLDPWPRSADGELDLDQAPVTLEAIVNRVDVRDLSIGMGGEGRFVFGINSSGFPLQATMIFEYNLPAQTEADVLEWAQLWHGLQTHPFPSEEYNAALEELTRRFASRGASPESVNGSALFSFRTNEIDLGNGAPWELRQFDLSPETGFFRQVPLSETPDFGFNESSTFANFVNQNAPAIIELVPGGTGNTVPAQFQGRPFQAGAVFNDLIQWSAPGITDPDARFHASMNTCNGCHGPETGSGFLQISPRFPGSEAGLSPFITGTTVFDQFSGQERTLNDLARRKADLFSLVCEPDAAGGAPAPAAVR